jgi:UDP-glucose 4-epimerase
MDLERNRIFVTGATGLVGSHAIDRLMTEYPKENRNFPSFGVNGTFNLLEGGVASRVKRFIYSSSISACGDPLESPMMEDHPFNITLMYGASKVSSELFLKIFKRAKGLDDLALRYAIVNGPRQRYRGNLVRYVQKFFDRIERGPPPIICADGSGP